MRKILRNNLKEFHLLKKTTGLSYYYWTSPRLSPLNRYWCLNSRLWIYDYISNSWMEGPILLGNELIQIIFNLVHHESINTDYLQNIHFFTSNFFINSAVLSSVFPYSICLQLYSNKFLSQLHEKLVFVHTQNCLRSRHNE